MGGLPRLSCASAPLLRILSHLPHSCQPFSWPASDLITGFRLHATATRRLLFVKFGQSGRTRTCNPRHPRAAVYQLTLRSELPALNIRRWLAFDVTGDCAAGFTAISRRTGYWMARAASFPYDADNNAPYVSQYPDRCPLVRMATHYALALTANILFPVAILLP